MVKGSAVVTSLLPKQIRPAQLVWPSELGHPEAKVLLLLISHRYMHFSIRGRGKYKTVHKPLASKSPNILLKMLSPRLFQLFYI